MTWNKDSSTKLIAQHQNVTTSYDWSIDTRGMTRGLKETHFKMGIFVLKLVQKKHTAPEIWDCQLGNPCAYNLIQGIQEGINDWQGIQGLSIRRKECRIPQSLTQRIGTTFTKVFPEPVYPEFMPPEDEVFSAEEQPLPAAVSPPTHQVLIPLIFTSSSYFVLAVVNT
ncbi:hypothetical protein Tco_0434599 [Tanacetum coccineum]